jgi:GDP-D-mannose dehydratase
VDGECGAVISVCRHDPSKAQHKLGWKHRVTFDTLVNEMVEEDHKLLRNEAQRRSPHE